MNKRALIKFSLLFFAFLIPPFLMIVVTGEFGSIFNPILILDLVVALSIFMYDSRKRIKKHNFIYNVINLLLIVVSVAYIGYIILSTIMCNLGPECTINIFTIIGVLYPIPLILVILYSFKDIFNKTNKTNDYLTILVSTMTILIHLRYYSKTDIFDSYNYLGQNYIYLYTMYLLVLIHYKLNKQES